MNDSTPLLEQSDTSVKAETPPPAMNSGVGASLNKSERIRQFLKRNPEARNKDVAADLADFGITPADVGNVKTQLKKKAAKKRAASTAKSPAKAKLATVKSSSPAATQTVATSDSTIGMDVLDAAIEFINRAGGLSEAQNALEIIRRIKSL